MTEVVQHNLENVTFCLRISKEFCHTIDKVGSIKRITTNSHTGWLPQTNCSCLKNLQDKMTNILFKNYQKRVDMPSASANSGCNFICVSWVLWWFKSNSYELCILLVNVRINWLKIQQNFKALILFILFNHFRQVKLIACKLSSLAHHLRYTYICT